MFNIENRPVMTSQEMLRSALEFTPDAGSYIDAHMSQAFDRTTTGRGMEEYAITKAEKEEGTWDTAYAQGQATQEFTGPFAGMQPPEHKYAMSEEEWKKSEYYVPTAKYRPDMTVTRARIQKENYDQRRYLEDIVNKGDDAFGLGMKALGFGASLVGSLPDPINLIPFAGGIKGAAAGASVGRSALKGAFEGAVGNAAVDAFVLPDLLSKGEDVGFADALLDITFGAVLGGALGGLGGYIGKKRRLLQQAQEETTPLPASDKDGSGKPSIALLERNEQADILRARLDPQSRRTLARSMEKALADMSADRPVDVSTIFENTPTISKVQYQHFVSQLEQADEFTNVRFGKLRPDLRDALNNIRTEEGVALLDGENLIIPANVVKKFHEKRVLKDKITADEVGQLLLDVFHRDADFVSSTKHPHIQAIVALKKELSTIGFIGRNDATGETVIKSVYHEKTPRLNKRLGGDGSNSGGRGNPHSVDGAEAPPFAASRLSAVQSGEPVVKTIDAPNREVNISVERPGSFTPAPALREETLALHEEFGVDMQTGMLPEEVVVNELDIEGRLAPEDREALLLAQEQARRAPEYDDIGQSIIPCILEVSDGK